jgi:cell division protein FtsB
MDTLRQETMKLHAKYSNGAAKIKKLEFDLEKEQGQINVLRNDNQSLRKKAVQMVNKDI